MCHLILIGLPLLALASFWLLPALLAIPTSIGLGRVRNVQGNVASIWVNSELWSARIVEGLRGGDKVEVVGVDGLQLRVRKVSPNIAEEPNKCSP